MPTENEYKFLLRRDLSVFQLLVETPIKTRDIEQGQLTHEDGLCLRIRKSIFYSKTTWLMTFKKTVKGRVVEVETELCERDGLDLWQCCHSKLHKVRHYLPYKDVVWEVDVFYNVKDIYCILAELELSEGEGPPSELPPLIEASLIHRVRQGDSRFSNKKLYNVDHANALYESFTKEGIQ